jgi:AraC family transcriptional regulator, regulatory protein of adaptative response / methylated-DNA-[protein]-cysteine methyltransferase
MLDFETCNAARLRHDAAFDGVLFVAVRTTRVYCRPVCRAGPALTKNVIFFLSAAAAERYGYRPCLRCRPETAPFCPEWLGTESTVARAVQLIDAGELDRASVEMLAEKLCIGARQLSRLFAEHLDASPMQVAQSRRIARAKRLLNQGHCQLSDIAVQSGFRSARHKHSSFTSVYGRAPFTFRRSAADI